MKVTLFSKTDCGLCEAAEEVLRTLEKETRFTLEIVDIESDNSLFERYWDRVPVVVVGDREVWAGGADVQLLRAALVS